MFWGTKDNTVCAYVCMIHIYVNVCFFLCVCVCTSGRLAKDYCDMWRVLTPSAGLIGLLLRFGTWRSKAATKILSSATISGREILSVAVPCPYSPLMICLSCFFQDGFCVFAFCDPTIAFGHCCCGGCSLFSGLRQTTSSMEDACCSDCGLMTLRPTLRVPAPLLLMEISAF